MLTSATFDTTGLYRYSLGRCWHPPGPEDAFVMLNPSTADAARDDPTLRACIQFAQRWEYGSLRVVNLFGYRTPHPAELRTVDDPVGSENDDYLIEAVEKAQRVVLAWGNWGDLRERDCTVLTLLKTHHAKLSCLQLNRSGQPRHPLYVRRDVPLCAYPKGTH